MNEPSKEPSAFELSRIHSQGWNAAKKLLAAGTGDVDDHDAAARNPYRTPEARARWSKGFMEALQSRAGAFTTPGGNSWRPAVAKRITVGANPRRSR